VCVTQWHGKITVTQIALCASSSVTAMMALFMELMESSNCTALLTCSKEINVHHLPENPNSSLFRFVYLFIIEDHKPVN